jgi:hypothetical protein
MSKSFKARGVALAASIALLGGAAFVASGSTGAYFSDTKAGTISGTIGSIKIEASGGIGNGTNFTFANMLPAVSQTVKVNYKNTGANAQDVWIVFNNATALSALNTLGRYGEVHLSANGTALFNSQNLNDNANPEHCVVLSPSGCWPLAKQYKVASNVVPNGGGSVSFSFNYSKKLESGEGAAWNGYPISAGQYVPITNKDGQTTVNEGDGTGYGLPYQIVATQHDIEPGQK